jgi:hypothetical protein
MTEEIDLTPNPRVDTSFLDSTGEHVAQAKAQRSARTEVSGTFQLTRGDIFKRLNQSIQLNEFGTPDFIYRADLIPADLFQYSHAERIDILNAATVPILFDYGYPATQDAKPLWEQLPGEPQAAYDAFVLALDLPEISKSEHPVRMLPLIAPMLKLELSQVAEYSHVYYWSYRFRAYDLYLAACHRKQREQRIMSIEGKHFTQAERYLAKIDRVLEAKLDHTLNAIQDPDSGEMDELKLKDLVDMVEKLTRIQRISVGLPANGNDTSPSRDVGGRMQTVEDSVKEIAAYSQPAKKQDTRSVDMDRLLSSPEDLAAMQDLLIKAHSGGS